MTETVREPGATTGGTLEPRRLDLLIVGHSHVTAIAAALARAPDPRVAVVNHVREYESERKAQTASTDLAARFAPKRVLASFGGSEHTVFGLIEAPEKFDFLYGPAPSVETGRWVVPTALVRSTLRAALERKLALLRSLKDLFRVPLTHICSPPPFRDADDLRGMPTLFRDRLPAGVVPPAIRLKLHALHSEILMDFCRAEGIDFLAPPPASRDADGFLRRDLWDRDPTHGNAAYGALILEQVLERAHG